jgi:hypothetical protein
MTDDVYRERACLVALVAALYPSVRAYSDPHEPEWSVVYVDSPAGQLSWHIAENDLDLFEHVEFVPTVHPRAQWDGHTTEEKYRRLGEVVASYRVVGTAGNFILDADLPRWMAHRLPRRTG